MVVIVRVGFEKFAQIGFTEHDDVVDTFPPNRVDETFERSKSIHAISEPKRARMAFSVATGHYCARMFNTTAVTSP
jgi:hypothetical protein